MDEIPEEKLKKLNILDREIHLQETEPAKYLTFGSEIWRYATLIVFFNKTQKNMKSLLLLWLGWECLWVGP